MPDRNCKDGWISTYLRHTAGVESPEVFHFWSAISAIACAMGRSTWVDFGFREIHPNMYVVLVGPSGRVRKTSASDIAMDLLRVAVPALDVLEGKATMPGIIKRMSETYKLTGDSRIVLYAGELKVLLGGTMSNSSMLEDLTELYAGKSKFKYITKGEGEVILNRVSINLLGASTPEWLTTARGSDFVASGFSARILYIYRDEPERRFYRATRGNGWEGTESDLIADLRHISELAGPFIVEPEAEVLWEKWYNNKSNFEFDDERFGPYMERKDKHMLKIAMVLRAGKDDSMVVTADDMRGAMLALNQIEAGMSDVYKSVSEHEVGRLVDRVIKQVAMEKDGVSRRDILRKNYFRTTDAGLSEVLKTCVASGKLRMEFVKRGTKTTEWYRINVEDEFV